MEKVASKQIINVDKKKTVCIEAPLLNFQLLGYVAYTRCRIYRVMNLPINGLSCISSVLSSNLPSNNYNIDQNKQITGDFFRPTFT